LHLIGLIELLLLFLPAVGSCGWLVFVLACVLGFMLLRKMDTCHWLAVSAADEAPWRQRADCEPCCRDAALGKNLFPMSCALQRQLAAALQRLPKL